MTQRRAWPTMGSMASLAIRGASTTVVDVAERRVRDWFERVEAALSPYRDDSDLCRWRSGAATLEECSPLLAEVVAAVAGLPAATGGGFHPYDRDGRFDPTGYVKGWAIERAVDLAIDAGVTDACLGIGGDLQMVGRPSAERPWRAGVVDPQDERRLVAIVEAPDGGTWAVATSGDAQRGEHIWAPPLPAARDLLPALRSVTVVGPQLRYADAYATAVWARARRQPLADAWAWLAGTGYQALAVDRAGWIQATTGMAAHLARPAA